MTISRSASIARFLTLAVLVITGALGLRNGLAEWPQARGTFQQSVTAGVFLYGVLGVVSAFGVLRRRRWSLWTTAGWGMVITFVATGATIAYGGAEATSSAAVLSGVLTALIAVAIFWSVRTVALRGVGRRPTATSFRETP